MLHRNLAVELLQKLLKGELATRGREERRPGTFVLRNAGANAPNRAIEAAQVIEE